ncbi:hypothetical protein C8Q77DRAFT_1062866 [Trametes polyzona]|nr:hypothetical protein C8Q77DRAFT_1062866 [Trametes polyzona]
MSSDSQVDVHGAEGGSSPKLATFPVWLDPTLSPEEAAGRLVELCPQDVQRLARHEGHQGSMNGDTPGLEGFLWAFWGDMFKFAMEDSSNHDRLIRILTALKARQGKEDYAVDWRIWGDEFEWAELPLCWATGRELMNGPSPVITVEDESGPYEQRLDATHNPEWLGTLLGDPPAPDASPEVRACAAARTEWLNLNTFMARLWARGVNPDSGVFYGISTMAMQLETHSLPPRAPKPRPTHPQLMELDVEVAAVWVREAGREMYRCREVLGPKGNPDWPSNRGAPGSSGGTWDGVDGYHPDRWKLWKSIFEKIGRSGGRRNMVDAANAAVKAMDEVEREAEAPEQSTSKAPTQL